MGHTFDLSKSKGDIEICKLKTRITKSHEIILHVLKKRLDFRHYF